MAAMAARYQAPSAFGGLIERAVMFADRASGSRLGQLLSTTGLVRRQQSPFGDFGVVVAAGSKPLPISNAIRDVAVFTIEEARERISSFVGGKFVPETVSDLLSYLGDRFLRLETRVLPQGRATNYLVDTKTNKAVPAAQVDPRLGHRAMLQASLRGAMRKHYAGGEPAAAFHSWEGMKLVMENDVSGLAYTVSGGHGYIGKARGLASHDPVENLAMIRAARASGVDLILPETRPGGGRTGDLIPGMPILVRSRSLKAEEVHPQLAHDRLSMEWGMGMDAAFTRMAERSRRNSAMPTFHGGANVVSIETFRAREETRRDDFRKRFVRREEAVPAPAVEEEIGFGGAPASSGKRDIVVRFPEGGGEPYVYDRDISEEILVSVRSLPPGRYPLESEVGVEIGWTDVGRGGKLRHLDLGGNRIESPEISAPGNDVIESHGRRMGR